MLFRSARPSVARAAASAPTVALLALLASLGVGPTAGCGASSAPADAPTATTADGLSSAWLSCGGWGAAEGYARAACEWDGNGACGGEGPATADCDHCCDLGP